MASWKRHMTFVGKKNSGVDSGNGNATESNSRFSSFLPEIYAGSPNRLERYKDMDQMDMDSTINQSLNVIANFCTQREDQRDLPFDIKFDEDVSSTEVLIVKSSLKQWCKINTFNKRLWKMVRNTIKYGDVFFIRDPETFELYWVDQSNVQSILINEADGKRPEIYNITNLGLNMVAKVATEQDKIAATGSIQTNSTTKDNVQTTAWSGSKATNKKSGVTKVDANHIVHISMSEGMDLNWPFGTSILEGVYKVFKQKQLLEDAVVIYRIQRAPERRVFHIDVGDMQTNKAHAYMERIKNEIHQKRIPNRTGGSSNMMDAIYNPLSLLDDFFFARTTDGRGSSVETLPGGTAISDLGDVDHFTKELKKGLGVPDSYLPGNEQDGQGTYNDGKIGAAMIQEFSFSQYCKRIQNQLIGILDQEFKIFLKKKGINIEVSAFELMFHEPQNFAKYRRVELDVAQIGVFTQVQDVPWLSKRYVAKRYLDMTEEEMAINEKMWHEENDKNTNTDNNQEMLDDGSPGLSSVGINQGGMDDFDMAAPEEEPKSDQPETGDQPDEQQ